jgi:hypothetical protein
MAGQGDDHIVIHTSLIPQRGQRRRRYAYFLQSEPNGLHAWLAVAFATNEATLSGHQAQHLVQCWWPVHWLLGVRQQIGAMDLIRAKEELGIEFGAGPAPGAPCAP